MTSDRAEIIGQRFGKWLVTGTAYDEMGGRMRHVAKCRCDCGTERLIAPPALRAGQSTQCRSCSNREKAAMKSRLTHGGTSSRLYTIWSLMKARCERFGSQDYHRYGARGIRVCDEWHDFARFRAWAEARGYSDELTIDRCDNDLGYSPGNCRWVSRTDQNRNRRDNQRYSWRGRRLMLSEISEIAGVSYSMLRQRVQRRGWAIERAVSQPPRTTGRKDV